jgi:UDP-N-acetylglucosamine 2-epimerase (non-hydrolysing)
MSLIKKIVIVAGARPNFMKAAPLFRALRRDRRFKLFFVHTGQHYDKNMSHSFLRDLGLPAPAAYLGVGSGSHAAQTACTMVEFEKVCARIAPNLVVVVGDVNPTMACALTAAKMNIPVAHVEAGLRSFDMTMPEEINRIVTDSISDYLFVSERSGGDNLFKEGKSPHRVFFVGNVMIDSLVSAIASARKSGICRRLGVSPKGYGVVTLHRPSNVDSRVQLAAIIAQLNRVAKTVPLVFPVHPRTRKNIGAIKNLVISERIRMINPAGYKDFLQLVSNSMFVLTDSGGIQEETTFLKIPCLTLRENTERPATVECGTNKLVSVRSFPGEVGRVAAGKWRKGENLKYWDGKAAVRIAKILARLLK